MVMVVFFEYLSWQYVGGVSEFLRAWRNIHWFLWRVFSVALLLRTFFAPFRRTSEPYERGFDPSGMAQTFLINLVTRLVGVMVRSVLLIAAIFFQTLAFVAGGAFFLLFLTTPVVIPVSVLLGIIYILL